MPFREPFTPVRNVVDVRRGDVYHHRLAGCGRVLEVYLPGRLVGNELVDDSLDTRVNLAVGSSPVVGVRLEGDNVRGDIDALDRVRTCSGERALSRRVEIRGTTALRAARRLEIVEVLDHLLRNVAREHRIRKMIARARLAPELYVVLHDEAGSNYVCPEISD